MALATDSIGQAVHYMGADGAVQFVSVSTATSDVSVAGGISLIRFQTATNAATTGQYVLDDGVQGQVVSAICTATANVMVSLAGSGTATGRRVFQGAGDMETYRFMGGNWYVISTSGPTIGTVP